MDGLAKEELRVAARLVAGYERQLHTVEHGATGSSFHVGVNDPLVPAEMNIEVQYSVLLKDEATKNILVQYESRHGGRFKILSWNGFDDWSTPPYNAMFPYLAFLHHLAVRRAETAISETGMRGLKLFTNRRGKTVPRMREFLADWGLCETLGVMGLTCSQ